MGVRVSGRDGVVRPDGLRRPAVRDVQCRLRLLARRRNRLRALGLPRAVGGPERVHRSAGSAERIRGSRSSSATSTAPLTRSPPAPARRSGKRSPIRIRSRESPARRCCSRDALYVPVASLEEPESGQADYACCTFRGYMSALDAATGREIWKTYTIPEVPEGRRQELAWQRHARAVRRRHLGDADARRQATGNLRHDRQRLLRDTEDRQRDDGDEHRHGQSALVDAGAARATPGTTGVRRIIPGGASVAALAAGGARAVPPARRRRAGHSLSAGELPRQCSGRTGTLRHPRPWRQRPTGATSSSRRRNRGSSGRVNPDNGQVLWKQDVAREIAGGRGETLFGGAVDSEKAYFGLISSGHLALDLKTGEEVWYTPLVPPAGPRESARRRRRRHADSRRAAVGCARRHDSRRLVADRSVALGVRQRAGVHDRQRRAARGGSAASGGPVVANGMVFIGSGYPGFQGGQPGNVLLAFAPAVRLDVHADELKRRSEQPR